MKRFFTAALFVLSFQFGFTQGPPVEWEKYYNPDWTGQSWGGGVGSKILQTPDGGYIIATTLTEASSSIEWYELSRLEHALIKLDRNGIVQWTRMLDNRDVWYFRSIYLSEDYNMDLQLTSDEGFLAYYISRDSGDYDNRYRDDSMVLSKLDKNGIEQWNLKYPTESIDPFDSPDTAYGTQKSILYHRALPSSQILMILANTTTSPNPDTSSTLPLVTIDSIMLRTFDLDLNLLSEKHLPDSIYPYLSRISPGYNDGYIASHDIYSVADSTYYTYIHKFDDDFDLVWSRNAGDTVGYFISFEQTPDGGFIFNRMISLLKLDSLCNFLWTKLAPVNPPLFGHSIKGFDQTIDNGFIVCGTAISGFFVSNYWIAKYDSAGTLLWEKLLGGGEEFSNDEYFALSITQTNDLGYIASGYSTDQSKEDSIWTVKIAADQYNNINVQAFIDSNANTIRDINEPAITDYFIQTHHAADTFKYAPVNNIWARQVVYDTGVFTTRIIDIPYYQVSPPQLSYFPEYYRSDTLYFAVRPTTSVTDLSVDLNALTLSREGQNTIYLLSAHNHGTVPANGTVKLVKDPRVDFVDSTPPADNIDGDTIIWNFNDFMPLTTSSWNITFLIGTPPEIDITDTIFTTAFINPSVADQNSSDNGTLLQDEIMGAVDPNDKTVNLKVVTPAQTDEGLYLDYVIRFQNTGNDTAFDIRIIDTLSSLVIYDSLGIVAYSHTAQLLIREDSIMQWYFEDIFLPDSNVNEAASHGYVIYRIKAKAGLTDGTIIPNKAAIYFDYRDAVITNTATTLVANPTLSSIGVVKTLQGEMQIVPNPNRGSFQIKLNDVPKGNYFLTINDVKGAEILKQNLSIQDKKTILGMDVKNAEGIYMISLFNPAGILTEKIFIGK